MGALALGIREGGGEPVFIGVIPTPGVAYLCRTSDATAGISISASHNPFGDNGVKIFAHDGMKVPDAFEEQLEEDLRGVGGGGLAATAAGEPPAATPDLVERYEQFLNGPVAPNALGGKRVVLD